MNREQWLEAAISKLLPTFQSKGYSFPTVRVSVGWPAGNGSKLKVIGQYFPSGLAKDGIPQIFISPVIDEPVRALDILVHELCHAVTPGKGHGKEFKKVAVAMGLEGKMTATTAGRALTESLTALSNELGPYPHAQLSLTGPDAPKKQGTRLLKAECPQCGYCVRITKTWLTEVGAPNCPQHETPLIVESKEEGEAA